MSTCAEFSEPFSFWERLNELGFFSWSMTSQQRDTRVERLMGQPDVAGHPGSRSAL
jgi:hypothetical protein